MNVYDFDGTIYDGDSSIDFYLFCLENRWNIVRFLPKQLVGLFLCKIKKKSIKEFKEDFFSFISSVENVEIMVDKFWDKKIVKIKSWYLSQKKEDDLIISASPEFLLKPVMKKLGVKNLIATKMCSKSGQIKGENCKGIEKVKRYKNEYPSCEIEKFYSDSMTDKYMADISKEAYYVKNNEISRWK